MSENMILCPKCFHETYDGHVCSHCGFAGQEVTIKQALPCYTMLHNRYIIGIPLGRGGFGMTYKCFDNKTHQVMVIKEFFPKTPPVDREAFTHLPMELVNTFRHNQQRFREEAQLLCELRKHHYQSIITASDYFDENGTSYYVMDYFPGITIKKLVSRYALPQSDLQRIFTQIALELDDIHTNMNLIHRDISADNILIDGNRKAVLIDFGAAKSLDQDEPYTVVGKTHYAPIEQYSRTKKQGPYTDVYALAATYYYVLTGHYVPEAPERILHDELISFDDLKIDVPEHVKKALTHALEVKPEDRTPNMAVFVRELSNKKAQAYAVVKDRKFLITEKGITVGRKEDNDICLPQHQITKHHMTITFDPYDETFLITDHSTNGTFVNGHFLCNKAKRLRGPVTINFPGILDEMKCEVVYE